MRNSPKRPIHLKPGDAFLLYTDGLFGWRKGKRRRGRVPNSWKKCWIIPRPAPRRCSNESWRKQPPRILEKPLPDDVAAIAVRREADNKIFYLSQNLVLLSSAGETLISVHAENQKKTSKRKPNPAFMRPVQPDDKLAAVVGSQPLSRPELTKKLWDYIKRRGLQDKKKRTMINADDALRPVFNGKSQVSMFEMTKLVSKHLR